jgi:hypothetical protein
MAIHFINTNMKPKKPEIKPKDVNIKVSKEIRDRVKTHTFNKTEETIKEFTERALERELTIS